MKKICFIIILFTLNISFNTSAFAVESDFNQDGIADIVQVQVNSDRSLSWNAKLSSTSSAEFNSSSILNTRFGNKGDRLILGNFLNPEQSQIGVIRASKFNNEVTWNIVDANGFKSRSFGNKNNIFVSGADFDGDGYLDPTIIEVDSTLLWRIKPKLFVSQLDQMQVKTQRKNKGLTYLNPHGGNDWIGYVIVSNRKLAYLNLVDPISNNKMQIKLRRDFKVNNSKIIPIARADHADNLVIVTKSNGKLNIVVKNINGVTVRTASFAQALNIISGEFLADPVQYPGEELLIQLGNGSYLAYNPFVNKSVAISSTKSTTVGTFNFARF